MIKNAIILTLNRLGAPLTQAVQLFKGWGIFLHQLCAKLDHENHIISS